MALTLCLSGCLLPPKWRTGGSGFRMLLSLDPETVSLADHRRVRVTASLVNRSKTLLHLDFPDSQRVEMLLRDEKGRVIFTWSEDQRIDPVPGRLPVNPGEKAVYELDLPTRGMSPGKAYVIEVFLPAHKEIRATLQLTPEA